jgi:hypothetical protein
MNPGTAIYNLLKDSATVGQLIGNKIYPGIIPDNIAYPAVTFSELSRRTIDTKDGRIPTGDHSFDVDVFSCEYRQAQNIADACAAVLDNYAGTVGTVEIKRIRLEDQQDLPYEDEKDIFHITQEYRIRVAE